MKILTNKNVTILKLELSAALKVLDWYVDCQHRSVLRSCLFEVYHQCGIAIPELFKNPHSYNMGVTHPFPQSSRPSSSSTCRKIPVNEDGSRSECRNAAFMSEHPPGMSDERSEEREGVNRNEVRIFPGFPSSDSEELRDERRNCLPALASVVNGPSGIVFGGAA